MKQTKLKAHFNPETMSVTDLIRYVGILETTVNQLLEAGQDTSDFRSKPNAKAEWIKGIMQQSGQYIEKNIPTCKAKVIQEGEGA